MRVAVISDVHGNCIAFDAVLEDLRHDVIDQIVCLGDMIQGGPQPLEVIDRLRMLGCPVVMGNADDWLLTGRDVDGEGASELQLAVRAWQLAQLSTDDRAFIQDFRSHVEIDLDPERKLLCFHGSPLSFYDILLPMTAETEFQRLLGPFMPHIMCGGHTHLQQLRRLHETIFFNPGSVGFSYRHHQAPSEFKADPWAEYAVLMYAHGRTSLDFRRIPFDTAALVQVYRSSGRPYAEVAAAHYRK